MENSNDKPMSKPKRSLLNKAYYICEICDNKFTSKACLQKHLLSMKSCELKNRTQSVLDDLVLRRFNNFEVSLRSLEMEIKNIIERDNEYDISYKIYIEQKISRTKGNLLEIKRIIKKNESVYSEEKSKELDGYYELYEKDLVDIINKFWDIESEENKRRLEMLKKNLLKN